MDLAGKRQPVREYFVLLRIGTAGSLIKRAYGTVVVQFSTAAISDLT